ncbi:MAG TPA: hypothetical protein PLD25_06900 [Chloroflexota bacterium]|nr:hypothetical protein [Chloroflexota bacterium]
MNEKLNTLVKLNQYRLENQYQAAIDTCKELLAEDENDADVIAVLAVLYHRLAFNRTEVINEMFETAILWANKAIEIKPDRADFYAIRGRIFLDFPDYEKAANDFRLALQIRPDLLSACFGLGFLARAAEEIVSVDEAIGAVESATKIHLDNPLVFSELHGLLTIKGHLHEANQTLARALLSFEPLPRKYT